VATAQITTDAVRSKIENFGSLDSDTQTQLIEALSYDVPGAFYTHAASEGRWDGRARLLTERGTYPTGLTARVRHILEERGYIVELISKLPTLIVAATPPQSYFPHPLIPEQVEAVQHILALREQRPQLPRGMISAPPRSGKTIIAAEAIRQINVWPVVFLNDRLDIAQPPRGTVTKFEQYFGTDFPIGHAYDGEFEPGNIVVMTIQTACAALGQDYKPPADDIVEGELPTEQRERVAELLRTTKVVVVDEAHHAAAPSYLEVLKQCKSRVWTIALSGTPWRDDERDLVMEGAVGPVIYEISYHAMITQHRLVPAHIYWVHMPTKSYRRTTSYKEREVDYILRNPVRNAAITRFCSYCVNRNLSVMVMTDQISQLRILDNWLKTAEVPHRCMTASGNYSVEPRLRQTVWDDLQEKRILCLVTTLGQEGLDIPSLDAVVIAAGGKSSVKCMQRFRAMTAWPGKAHCLILDFADRGRYFTEHAAARLAMYTSHPAGVFHIHHVTSEVTTTDPELVKWLRSKERLREELQQPGLHIAALSTRSG